MSVSQVYTPKAVILITRIKRNLSSKHLGEHFDSWDYQDICTWCETYEDEELQQCLHMLEEEIHHSTKPNTWAI